MANVASEHRFDDHSPFGVRANSSAGAEDIIAPRTPAPGHPDPRAVERWRRYAAPLIRMAFRPELHGAENLPTTGPFMLVANHSGLGLADIMSFIVCYIPHLGVSRPLAAMVHPAAFNSWPAGGWMRRLGCIPSTYEAAEAALANGISVLVFPGGDHEAGRPIWQANQVQFAGRKGFLKIARKAGVPIVPMGIRGSHFTAPILWRSDRVVSWLLVLPRLTGMKRLPVTLLGVLGLSALLAFGPVFNWWITSALAWLWLVTPLSRLPWIPWKVRISIGAPVPPADLLVSSDDGLDTAYARVESLVREVVRSPSNSCSQRGRRA